MVAYRLMKRMFIFLITSMILVACNSGGGDLNISSYMPSGKYILMTTSHSSDLCQLAPSIVTINSQGELCGFSKKACLPINVALDPCFDVIAESTTYLLTMKWNNCQLSSTSVLTGVMNVSLTEAGKTMICSAKLTIMPK